MITPYLTLLVTNDSELERHSTNAVRASGGAQLVARNVGDALRILCARRADLDFAVIDLDNGCRGMTLLSAMSMLRRDLPIAVITGADAAETAALAYANGAAGCLAKPASATDLEILMRALREQKPQLQAA